MDDAGHSGLWRSVVGTRHLYLCVVLALGGCALSAPPFEQIRLPAERLTLPASTYYGIVALGDDEIALARATEELRDAVIEIIDVPTDAVVDAISLEDRPECVLQRAKGLSLLPDGRLTFAEVCESTGGLPSLAITMYAYDRATRSLEPMGDLADQPITMAWNTPTNLLYTAGTTLCETLYERGPEGDGPIDIRVVVQGSEMSLGEDVVAARNRCTEVGNAAYPAVRGDGKFAAFAKTLHGVTGSGVVDMPWAILTASGDETQVILDGVHYPGGIAWLTDSRLLFTGSLLGREGMWSVNADGTDLALLGEMALAPISLSPDRSQLFGLSVRAVDPNRPDAVDVDIYRYDLSSR